MENTTGYYGAPDSIPMENTQKKYLKEIKKYSSVPEKIMETETQKIKNQSIHSTKNERQKMFDLLVSICKIDPNIKRGI
jgi:t-SNARE complex subunit (syntaxin)